MKKNGKFSVMSREHNRCVHVIEFVNKIKDRIKYYMQRSNLRDNRIKRTINFIGDMLRVRGLCELTNRDLDGIGRNIYYAISGVLDESLDNHDSNEIHFRLFANYTDGAIYVYGQQVFLLPFETGTRRICIDEFKNMLSHLLTNIGVLTILLPGTDNDSVDWFHLTKLDVETGFCICGRNDGIKYPTNINTLAKALEDAQLIAVHICYLDEIPEINRLLVRYSDGERLWWDTFHQASPIPGNSDYEFESSSDSESDDIWGIWGSALDLTCDSDSDSESDNDLDIEATNPTEKRARTKEETESEPTNPTEKRARTEEETESEAKKN